MIPLPHKSLWLVANQSIQRMEASRLDHLQFLRQRRLVPTADAGRSPMRAERAKPKSCKDDEIIAQGKRSAALGYGRKMVPSFFPSGFARPWRAKPEGKKELGWVGSRPGAAASAALPRAIITLPPWGAGKANQRAGDGGGMSALFRAGRLWPAAPDHGRSATLHIERKQQEL
jgi:hypothetical protein